jgi:hypothetical protein
MRLPQQHRTEPAAKADNGERRLIAVARLLAQERHEVGEAKTRPLRGSELQPRRDTRSRIGAIAAGEKL